MKSYPVFMFLLFAVLFYAPVKAQQKVDTNVSFKKLDEYLNSAVSAGKFNGSVLIAQNGTIVINKGYGWKNFAGNVSNDANTVYQIGSLTKPFTAMVILKLQEEGKLSVNDKLSKYFPDQTGADKITLQNLLDHTSGLDNYTDVIGPEDSAIVSHPIAKQKILDIFSQKPLRFKPGTKFDYCNSGYYLLGMIIEKLTGIPYEQEVRQLIFGPLKMTHSGFDFINLKDTAKAVGYVTFKKDKHIPAVKWDSTVTYAPGAIYSITSDLYKWGNAIAKKQLLSETSWKQAFTPHLENYGDGWWIDTLYGNKYITHSGGLPGFMSNFIYFPDQDLTIILLNNFGNYGESLWSVNTALAAIMFNKPYNLWQTNTAINVDEATLQQYTGTYILDGKVKIYITLKDGQLYAESSSKNGIPKLPIYAKSENEFFLKDFNAVFSFIKDANGAVSTFISHENGKNIVFKKIK